jgi:hypothetical protein
MKKSYAPVLGFFLGDAFASLKIGITSEATKGREKRALAYFFGPPILAALFFAIGSGIWICSLISDEPLPKILTAGSSELDLISSALAQILLIIGPLSLTSAFLIQGGQVGTFAGQSDVSAFLFYIGLVSILGYFLQILLLPAPKIISGVSLFMISAHVIQVLFLAFGRLMVLLKEPE